jgi:hypothetical protein
MASRSRSVCSPMELLLLGAGTEVSVQASLTFRADDPYAVHVAFHTDDGQDDVEWLFARQLLSAGLLAPAGEGDVRIWPGPARSGTVYLELRSPNGHAVFEAQRAALVDFVLRSYVVVPPGCESGYLDLDAELTLLHDDPA